MDLTRVVVQILIAMACAGAASFLVPRRVPGRLFGLALIGFAGVQLGEWSLGFLNETYELTFPDFVTWRVQNVLIVPTIAGSAVILYIVTKLLAWGRYQRW